ncbi:DUF6163 family protein [Daeguia caeni]|uniref:DUF6163 family protein n=1 Tax=Daeguia caeni TaxID=439612 RepID=A0ABV9H8G9_9HYPH
MQEIALSQTNRFSDLDWAYTLFLRLLALFVLGEGVLYWVRLIGIFPGLLWRFDLMPWMWQTACVALAVLLPVAACGLWMRTPWGAILWFIAAVGEIMIYAVFDRYFEYRPFIAVFNGAAILTFMVFVILLHLERRKQMRAKALV